MRFEIRSWSSGALPFEAEAKDLRTALELAVRQGVSLREADLEGARLKGVELEGGNLGGANLAHADLGKARLDDADLIGASLAYADLRGASLAGALLRGADLGGADLREADLTEVDFRLTNLKGADFLGAKLNFYSHELLAEILSRAAADNVEKLKWTGLLLLRRDWHWENLVSFKDPLSHWALDELRGWVGNKTPKEIKKILGARKIAAPDRERE